MHLGHANPRALYRIMMLLMMLLVLKFLVFLLMIPVNLMHSFITLLLLLNQSKQISRFDKKVFPISRQENSASSIKVKGLHKLRIWI